MRHEGAARRRAQPGACQGRFVGRVRVRDQPFPGDQVALRRAGWRHVVQQALIEWLSDEIDPRGVELRHIESTLFVHITYLSKIDQRAEAVSFEVTVP